MKSVPSDTSTPRPGLASGAGRSAAAGAIVVGMASPAETTTVDLPPLPKPGASPGEIRAALWPDYRAALEEAGQELDLAPVHAVLEHWRMRAWMTRDRATHRPFDAPCRRVAHRA